MNLKLRTLLWFTNTVNPMQEKDLSKINSTRKQQLFSSELGKFLFDKKEKVYSTEDSNIDGIKIRIYRHSDAPNQNVIIYFHGGGFVLFNIDSHDYITRRLCAMNQCTVISVDYRLAPEATFPAAHQDAYKAIQHIAENAAKYKINSSKIVLAGDSAGGNIAACAAHHFKNSAIKIAGLILIYPWVDGKLKTKSIEQYKKGYLLTEETIHWFQEVYVPNEKDRLSPEISPIYQTDFTNLPPTFIITAEYDPLKDDGIAYVNKLKENNNKVWYKDYKGLPHAFINFSRISAESKQCFYDIQAVLKEVFV